MSEIRVHPWGSSNPALSGGTFPVLDAERGLRRARAATLFELALPGSAYLYQGEELGLHELADIPPDRRQDPAFFRNPGVDIGRDGCRVPIPWTADGPSFGFGPGTSHLPQPATWGEVSVEVQERDPDSTLRLYRDSLALRRVLQTGEQLEWIPSGARCRALPSPERLGGRDEFRPRIGRAARGRGAPVQQSARGGAAGRRVHRLAATRLTEKAGRGLGAGRIRTPGVSSPT